MNVRLIFTAALALGFVGSSIAEAQYRTPNKRPRPNRKIVVQAKVDSWTPKAGAVGTLVTINGSGFTRKAVVLVGGRKVRPVKMGSRVISFKIPASYGDGQIVMRQAGVAKDYSIGQFQVWADPLVSSFSPSSGPPGTRVEIRGRNFNSDDLVMLGSQRLRIEKYADTGIIVTIPPGAVSGYFSIQNRRNASVTSRRQFAVVAPAPYITDFTPNHGQPGTVVRINGGNYGDDIRISYGRKPMVITRRGTGWVEAAIPADARRDKAISISSRRGGVRSAVNFALEMPPVLSSYSPSWGTPGTRVAINGRNFRADDRITLGGQDCKIVQITDRQVTVEVPHSASTGAFAIHRGGQAIKSASRFNVFYKPELTNMSVLKGPPGTQVNLTGQNLGGAKLYLGNVEIRPTQVRPNQIVFVIPPKARSGRLRVTSRGGEASYKRVSPQRGGYGTQVTLSGSELGNATNIFLGDVEMPILSRPDENHIVVQVPKGASSGPISWTAYGRSTETRWNFDVMRAPVFHSFSPTGGAAGSTVTIEGENFNRNTRVLYGNSSARVISWEEGRLTAIIPPRARQSDYLSVQGDGGGMNARTAYTLLVAPTARSFSPRRGKPGSELSINGSGLAMDTLVQVGGAAAKVLRASRDGRSLSVLVPELATGVYDVSVQAQGMRTVARKRFLVDGWGAITDIRPRRARVGSRIMLSGSGLGGARVFYGSYELPVVRADRRGSKLWVTIPEGCSGSSALTLDDQGHRSQSAMTLEIEAPPPPPPPTVNDHRKKKKGPKVHDHRKKRKY
jgi:hypothetical protein